MSSLSIVKRTLVRASLCVAGFLALGTESAFALSSCGSTGGIIVGSYRIAAWKSDNFAGSKYCRYYNDPLTFVEADVVMTAGGYDAGVGRNIASGKKVSDMSTSIGIQATIVTASSSTATSGVPSGSGHWWAGPKTIISSTASYSGLTGQYECYVIEKAEKTPSQLVSYMGGTYRGEGTFDGSVYKHYTVVYAGINQVWSIRQNYRNGGWTSVGYIQKQWKDLGLVPGHYYCLGWKYNVEFNGANTGKIKFQGLNLPYN